MQNLSFICMRIKNHFHINGFALSLALKQRLEGTTVPLVPTLTLTLTLTRSPYPPILWTLSNEEGLGTTRDRSFILRVV